MTEELGTMDAVEVTTFSGENGEGGAEAKRGRPRSPDAEARDERVFNALADGAQKTRDEIATELEYDGGLTYLSLYRLRKAGRVSRVDGTAVKRAWAQVQSV